MIWMTQNQSVHHLIVIDHDSTKQDVSGIFAAKDISSQMIRNTKNFATRSVMSGIYDDSQPHHSAQQHLDHQAEQVILVMNGLRIIHEIPHRHLDCQKVSIWIRSAYESYMLDSRQTKQQAVRQI